MKTLRTLSTLAKPLLSRRPRRRSSAVFQGPVGPPGEAGGRLRPAIVAAASPGEPRIDGPAIRLRRACRGPRLAAGSRLDHRRRPGQERSHDRRTQRLPAAGHRSDVAPRRPGARPGDEPAGSLLQGLACLLRDVRPLRQLARRRGWRLRRQRPQRQAAPGPEGDHERDGIAHHAQSPRNAAATTRRDAANCSTACRWAT